tara:strand:- start:4540 stop:5736 length:1197 start_codon:yes stop_codon:yes gene_type:complete
MNILESYSLQSGLKIEKPFIYDSFFPLTVDRYITFHSHSKFDSRNYSYLQEVVSLLKSSLKGKNITIVQVGLAEDPEIPGALDLRGKCTINQTAYIISKSMAHFGVDSFLLHLASHYDVPFVGIYSNMFKEQSMPLWGDTSKQIHIQSPRDEGHKPTYSTQENPKTINRVMPEQITNSVISLIDKKEGLKQLDQSTIHLGSQFQISVVEVVPNFVSQNNLLQGTMINLRLDLGLITESLPYWLSNRQVNLISKEPLSLEYIYNFKNNIKMVNFDLTDLTEGKAKSAITNSYLKDLKKVIPNVNLFVRKEDLLPKTRLQFFDWEVNLFKAKTKENLDKSELVCDNTYYKSAKSLLSEGKQYQSIAAWKNKIEYQGEPEKIIDQEDFWADIDHYRVFNKQ